MKGLKLLVVGVAALAFLVMPAGALAKSRDRNHDRIPDKWEKRHHLSTRVNVAHKDPDRDGLANISEFRHGTDPQNADTDDDGVGDKQEIEDHTNPDDGEDGGDAQEVSGTVASFDGTTLVIQPAGDGAGTVTGTVNSATEVKCEREHESDAPTATTSEDGGGSDDNSGPGSTSSGDDDVHETEPAPQPCTIAVGDVVHEAKFVQSDGGNTFTMVELTK